MDTTGQIAYEAYRKFSAGKSLVSGQSIPEWKKLTLLIKQAWQAAADAVEDRVTERKWW